jgi:hypothetical protein
MKKYALLLLFLILAGVPAFGGHFSLTGYYKNFFVVFDPPAVAHSSVATSSDNPMGMVSNRLRLNFFYDPNEWLSFSLSYNVLPRVQDPALSEDSLVVAQVDLFRYRFKDFRQRLYPEQDEPRSFVILQNLDRAFLTIRTAAADIFIGRQAIAWGSSRVINPTDILAPFTFDELDAEDRVGVDAVRVRIPLGFMGEMDSGYIFGKDFKFKKSAFYIRGKFYAAETDFSFLFLGFAENLMAGWDISRSLGGAGFWFEGAYVFVDAFRKEKEPEADNYVRTTIGLDYSFSGKTYGFLEYHFSSAGTNRWQDYLLNILKPGRLEGAVYLMGKHYLIPGISYQISPLITFSGQALINLIDASLFLAPYVEYNISPNIYLSAGAFIGIGKGPEAYDPRAPFLGERFRSEFGGYPDIYFSSFRVYF